MSYYITLLSVFLQILSIVRPWNLELFFWLRWARWTCAVCPLRIRIDLEFAVCPWRPSMVYLAVCDQWQSGARMWAAICSPVPEDMNPIHLLRKTLLSIKRCSLEEVRNAGLHCAVSHNALLLSPLTWTAIQPYFLGVHYRVSFYWMCSFPKPCFPLCANG